MSYGLRGCRGVRGLGVLNYYDLLAQAGLENCSPMDSACVSNNVAKQAAVEDFWAAHQGAGVPDDTRLTFTPQTAAQVAEFYNPKDIFNSGNVVDTRGIMQVDVPEWKQADPVAPVFIPSSTPIRTLNLQKSSPVTGAAPSAQTPAQGAPDLSTSLQVPGGSSFSMGDLPWYVWAGGAAALLFAFGRGK